MHSRYIDVRLPSEVETVEVRQAAHRQEQAGESLQMPSLTDIGLTPTAGRFGIIKGAGRHEYSRSVPLCLNGLITLTSNRNHCAWPVTRRTTEHFYLRDHHPDGTLAPRFTLCGQ